MKKTLLTTFVLLFIIQANAQQFIYEYENKLINYKDDCILLIQGEESYFNTLNSVLRVKYMKEARAKGNGYNANEMAKASLLKGKVAKFNNEVFRYDYLVGARLLVVFPSSDFNWQLGSETKEVDGKTLHKATTHYGGRDWIAWYNMEIPSQEGPYVFAGLPGLIEEVHDTENLHSFMLKGKSTENYESEFVKVEYPNRYTKVTFSEYYTFLGQAKENASEFGERHSPLLIDVEITPEMKKAYNTNTRKRLKYCTIERPEPKE